MKVHGCKMTDLGVWIDRGSASVGVWEVDRCGAGKETADIGGPIGPPTVFARCTGYSPKGPPISAVSLRHLDYAIIK